MKTIMYRCSECVDSHPDLSPCELKYELLSNAFEPDHGAYPFRCPFDETLDSKWKEVMEE